MSFLLVFDEFELDAARFELRRHGRRVPVQPKVLRLLLHLAAERDRSVSERELLATLWPDAVVGAASVRRAVRGARNALGERGDGESSIRTVRGHGYQFVRPVREVRVPIASDAAVAIAASAAPQAPPRESGESHVRLRAPELPKAADPAQDAADVFVGREGVLAAIDAALGDVLAGGGGGMLLVGEPGIGKTHTLRELARRAQARGALVWSARCPEVDGAPAFWPVVQIVRESIRGFQGGDLLALMGPGAADIAQAIPELRKWLPGLPEVQEIDSAAARFRFFDSMALFLSAVAERQPLVVLVDDVHAADEPTQRLLAFLVRELERSRVLFAFARRPPTTAACRLASGAAMRSTELHGLSACEVAHYLELRMRTRAPHRVVERLHQQTGGNPLFLEQILSGAAVRSGDAAALWARSEPDVQGQGLLSAIERHLAVLSAPCRALLRTAAVLGREFSGATLRELADVTAEDARLLLAEAVAAGVVKPLLDELGPHRFAHALIRDALYAQLPPDARARLHGCAGRALEAIGAAGSDELLPELAEHFVRAAPRHRDQALRYTLRAAAAAKQRLAYEETALQLDRALQLIDRAPSGARVRLALLVDKTEALCAAGQAGAARACALLCAELARELRDAQSLAAAAALVARSSPESGSVDAVQVDLLREALDALPAVAPQRALLQGLLAKALMYARDPGPCAQIALAARSAARGLGDAAIRAEALFACHEALAAPQHWSERLSIADELAALGHERGDHAILVQAATVRIWNCVELGDMAGADSALCALETLAEHVRDPFARWRVRVFRAMRALVRGQLEQAERLAGEAHALGSELVPDCADHVYAVHMCGVRQFQGRLAEAEAVAHAISLRHPALAGWRVTVAGIRAELGHRDEARSVLRQLMERDLDPLRRDPFVLSALAPAADLCARLGDAELAGPLYGAILPFQNQHGNVSTGISTHGPMARHLGVLAMCIGDYERAVLHLQHAIAAAEAMRSPPFFALSSMAGARALVRLGRSGARERAAEWLGRAVTVARAAGLSVLERAGRDLAGALRLRLPARASSSETDDALERLGSSPARASRLREKN